MLDLDPGVHLHEGVAAVGRDEELDGAGVDIADGAGELDGRVAQGRTDLLGQAGSRRQLDDLLVAALDRAVALEQVHHLAVGVGEHLHLDVPGPLDGLLEEDRAVTEGSRRLARCADRRVLELARGAHEPEPPAAAARRRLDKQWETDLLGGLGGSLAVGQRPGGAQHRQSGADRRLPRPHLVAGQSQHLRRWADEGDPGVGARLGQRCALGQEAVARVQRVGARALCHLEQRGDVEVAPHRVPRFAELVGLAGLGPVQAGPVLRRIDADGGQAELVRRADDPHGDLTAVGDQDLAHADSRCWVATSG